MTGSNGCTATELFNIINTNSNFSFNGAVLPNTSCIAPNGSIDLTLTPAGSYSFIWSSGASTEDLQNLSAGNYSVTVSDINNCALVESYSIQDILSYPIISSQVTPSSCGNSNGAIDINVIPANGNSYSWSNGSTGEDQSNLQAGNYFVTVTSLNGCMTIDTISVGNQNSIFTLTALTTPNSSCINSNGSIDLSITPSGTYSYVWSNGATTEDLQNMAAGSYTVTVTDILNCFSSDTFLVADNISIPVLSANITSANCGANNGSIDLIVNPIINTTFLWSNTGTTEDLQNIFHGSYSVIVTDTTNGCQVLDTFNVQNINNNFSISASTVPNTSCTSQTGSIDLTIAPAGTYTFIWSNGFTSEDLSALNPGSYTVTVTDNASCSSSAVFIVDNNTPITTISTGITPSTCGNNNGVIDLTINPSVGNSFLWSNGATTEDLQNLVSGIYSLTVTGSNGCTTSDTVFVPDVGSTISLSASPTANTNCVLPNGSIDLTVAPAGTYTYTWSNGFSSEDLTILSPGIYSVTVSDSNSCSSIGTYSIDDQTVFPAITDNISPSTCGQNNGQIDISITPAGNYQFIWSNGDTNEDLQNIYSGTYMVTVTGDNGCSASTTLLVQNTNSNFSISASTSDNTSCTTSNGAINLSIVPSGTYNFLWSNGATSEDLQNLPAGIYTVTVTDLSNCSTQGSYILADNVVNLIVEETITPALCGDANGRIDLNVTPPAGNNFIWSDGTTNSSLENILPGIYSVTVTGQNGCTWSSAFTMPGSEKIELDLEVDAIQTTDQFVTIKAQINVPITALDTLIWLPENLFNCPFEFCPEQTIARPSQQTEIIVMVVDTNGCMAQARLLLDDESNPQVFIPNVFSPNGDGVNDLFTIYGNKDVKEIVEMRIFDRWGNFVYMNTHFPPNEENYGWDGSFRNSNMNPDVFAYWARVQFVDGAEGFYKGDITLVR
ncbi:MAG: gliding motility-associated C-terminal domain-containing protein [Saprospiraceae bacterium]|uniref:Gliding motility-associated C-terminal domain-containing protein n=1 Tax=Candidatus Opimibacter skivensis TaxID=2982028 RepID=A0A9D7XSC6_9BACT|nr:gliding motility-associated C-terminal domain-containing protein [Candidatus Opimibacter skivensis]